MSTPQRTAASSDSALPHPRVTRDRFRAILEYLVRLTTHVCHSRRKKRIGCISLAHSKGPGGPSVFLAVGAGTVVLALGPWCWHRHQDNSHILPKSNRVTRVGACVWARRGAVGRVQQAAEVLRGGAMDGSVPEASVGHLGFLHFLWIFTLNADSGRVTRDRLSLTACLARHAHASFSAGKTRGEGILSRERTSPCGEALHHSTVRPAAPHALLHPAAGPTGICWDPIAACSAARTTATPRPPGTRCVRSRVSESGCRNRANRHLWS